MNHIKATQKANPTMIFKDVLVLAGKTYKKGVGAVKSMTKKSKPTKKRSGKVKKSRKHGKSKRNSKRNSKGKK